MNYQALQTALKAASTYREMQAALKKARDEFQLDIPCKLNAKKAHLQAAIAILVKFTQQIDDFDFEASVEIKPCLTDEEETAFLQSFTEAFPIAA